MPNTIVCDQAIFTSARGPAGEGYRIVAASKGLRIEEKQKITRCSPSHESLCAATASEASLGVAFYPLPGGRLCVAISRHAGAEQSGRGGQRVYTHNLVVSADDFESCAFNPFAIVRALPRVELDLQKLHTTQIIPQLEIAIDQNCFRFDKQLLPPAVRMAAVQQFLNEQRVVLDLPADWLEWAEALVLAIPGPLRRKISFSAGVRFSAGRGHILSILHDEKHVLGSRAAAQGYQFFDAASTPVSAHSSWVDFVERHWSKGDLKGLSNRTSRKYEDCSAPARERVGGLFNSIDSITNTQTMPLLDTVFRTFNVPQQGVEGEIRKELRDLAQQELRKRLLVAILPQIKPAWTRLTEFWRNGGEPALFAQPLLQAVISAILRNDPLAAAEMALSIAQAPRGIDADAHQGMVAQVASRLANQAIGISPDDEKRCTKLLAQLQALQLTPATATAR